MGNRSVMQCTSVFNQKVSKYITKNQVLNCKTKLIEIPNLGHFLFKNQMCDGGQIRAAMEAL